MEAGRGGQTGLALCGLLLTAPALALTAMRLLPPEDDALALVAAFIPVAIPLLVLAALCWGAVLVRARRRAFPRGVLAALGLVLAAQVGWQLPLLVPDGRPVVGSTFTLLSLNAFRGEADPAMVTSAAAGADVVVLVEVTPAFVQTLAAQGWRDRFTYTAGTSEGSVTNTVVYSRFPLSASTNVSSGTFDQWATTVEIPEIGPVGLVAVHPCNPYCGGDLWAEQHEALRRVVEDRLDQPLVLAGDFNAVPDHGPMQELRRLGMRSATDLLGSGWVWTYPANRRLPPLLAIDHVLVNPALAVADLDRVRVPGTDHLGLVARIGRAG